MSELTIRPEEESDRDAMHRLVEAAFGREDEAQLVDALRASAPAFRAQVGDG